MKQSLIDRGDGGELTDTKTWRCAFGVQLTTALLMVPTAYDMGTDLLIMQ